MDYDVEEPNAHLLLNPEIRNKEHVYSLIPKVDESICNYCGKCAEFCQYNAIFVVSGKILVFQELCHSCGDCLQVCPKKAITEEKYEIGKLKYGLAGELKLVYRELKISELWLFL